MDRFRISLHPDRRIVDVLYPAEPTAEALTGYAEELQRLVTGLNGAWGCLVDQRPLKEVTPELVRVVAMLNSFGQGHGMQCAARVIVDKTARATLLRTVNDAALTVPFLAGTPAVSPSTVSVGQTFTVSLQVANNGQATANNVTPAAPIVTGTGGVTLNTSPSARAIAGGANSTFSWTYVAASAGSPSFQLAVAGTDANNGSTVGASGTAGPLLIQTPALMDLTITASPNPLTSGQTVTVAMFVTNIGQATAQNVFPVAVTPHGDATLLTSPSSPVSLVGGASTTFTFTYATGAAGSLYFSGYSAATDLNSGAPIASFVNSNTVTVQTAPSLSGTAFATPSLVNAGSAVTVRLRVHNAGQASAQNLSPAAPVVGGSGTATLLSGPTPASATLTGGQDVDFVWTYTAATTGTLNFTLAASGQDANTLAAVNASAVTSSDVTAQNGASLTNGFTAPTRVSTGQTFTVRLGVSNSGDAAANAVAPSTLSVGGTGSATLVSGPTPATQAVPGGAARNFDWSYTASAAGTLTFNANAIGTDAVSGLAVSSPAAPTANVTVDAAAALSGAFLLSSVINRGDSFTLTLRVTNTGGASANSVSPSAPSFTGTASLALTGTPSPSTATIAGGASYDFVWTYAANAAGSASFSASASGTDANSGATPSTGTVNSGPATVVEVQSVVSNPLGENLTSAQIVGHAGRIYFGPRAGGVGLYRSDADGSNLETAAFSFFKDTTGNSSRNAATPPYASIGASGCSGATCGPDNEDGTGSLFSATVGSTQWLGIGGARSGSGLRYVYASSQTGVPVAMSYADVSTVLTASTAGLTAARVFHNRLYLGLSNTQVLFGGAHLIELPAMPTSPGLDGVSGSSAIDLNASGMPNVGGGAAPSMIDTLTDYVDRLFLFNSGGCAQSTSNDPGPYFLLPLEWTGCNPGAGATGYSAKDAWLTSKISAIEPEDRAFPGAATFNGLLYVARNVDDPSTSVRGAQLYACDATVTGSATVCNAGDWSAIAFNSAGDANLATFNSSGNYAISLLVATPSRLYVGFNHATRGAQVYRSRAGVTFPTALADFEGKAGCVPGAACEGLAGDGFGVSPLPTRIFSSTVLTFSGKRYVYFTAGNGTAPFRVLRIFDP